MAQQTLPQLALLPPTMLYLECERKVMEDNRVVELLWRTPWDWGQRDNKELEKECNIFEENSLQWMPQQSLHRHCYNRHFLRVVVSSFMMVYIDLILLDGQW